MDIKAGCVRFQALRSYTERSGLCSLMLPTQRGFLLFSVKLNTTAVQLKFFYHIFLNMPVSGLFHLHFWPILADLWFHWFY